MPIINEGSANTNGITSYTLTIGKSQKLYTGVTATGGQSVFGLPPQSSNYRGHLVLQAVGMASGTQTAFTSSTFDVEVDMGGGLFAGIQGLTGQTLTTPCTVDMSGFGGNGNLRLNFKTLTLGSATSIDVYAQIG